VPGFASGPDAAPCHYVRGQGGGLSERSDDLRYRKGCGMSGRAQQSLPPNAEHKTLLRSLWGRGARPEAEVASPASVPIMYLCQPLPDLTS
jgi:hypothetical protein